MRLKVVIFSLLVALLPLASSADPALCERLFAAKTTNFDTLKSFGNLDRITDLNMIKKYIEFTAGKVTIVVDHEDIPKGMSKELINFLYGAEVIVVKKYSVPKKKKITGVVLHLGDADYLKDYYVGDLNLLKAPRGLYKRFDDKLFEVGFVESIAEGKMPRSIKFTDLEADLLSEAGPELISQIKEITKNMINEPKFKFSSTDREALIQYLDLVMKLINAKFPGGAVIKHAREFQTGDTDGIIKSNKNNSSHIVDLFISSFYEIRKGKLKERKKKLSRKNFDEDATSANFNKRYTLVQSLLYGQFNELMAQQLLKILREIRLDVARGNVIRVVDRFDEAWGPKDLFAAAEEFVNSFFEKVPLPYKLMAGGVDIALLEDGSFNFIDLNFGATSGFLDGPKAPVTTNMYVANLLGRKTPLLEELAEIGQLPFKKKAKAIELFAEKYFEHLSEEGRESAVWEIVRWLGHEGFVTETEEAALLPQ